MNPVRAPSCNTWSRRNDGRPYERARKCPTMTFIHTRQILKAFTSLGSTRIPSRLPPRDLEFSNEIQISAGESGRPAVAFGLPLCPPPGRMTLVPATKQREKPSLFSFLSHSSSLHSTFSLISAGGSGRPAVAFGLRLCPPPGRMTLVPSTKQREKPSLFSLFLLSH
ncbi:hypothetical protein BSL78_10258 [Apostichopus japonicus]|uniref:Uncharacterized protein n=1 Tax=Stichopus japonicus TaxID=307972 RepID=A0A2G8KXY7_STIJA|nr:hypothetical protein BSL78_10258 [Apostichopus japonicus]